MNLSTKNTKSIRKIKKKNAKIVYCSKLLHEYKTDSKQT